ncbi:flagellar hook-associated protein FlgK [Pseudoxanthomonas sp.]|uniref:flagellar hook-associated protein FlgK n=1 Tax=Pseudoxanthomonas sp. TaxID=1871049 RepID=UPI00261A0D87|nr:flagellar hook-associated protein FlgK [Pseudoxanthomonas sp.]WDS36847.1 MAG: flagellar hook-associated protein FlgK [Pseudoxanthomonas sp.]
MPNLFSTGTSALLGYQRSLATISNNVANANTPGYSRQVTDLSTLSTDGVQVQGVKRTTDSLATARVLDSNGELNRLDRLSTLSGNMDGLLSDKTTNLSGVWSGFFDALSGLGSDPSSNVSRQAVLQSAGTLANRFNQLDASLDSMSDDVDSTLSDSVKQVNDLTSQIAKLNRQISQTDSPALEALDKRDALIEKLVSFTGGTTASQDDGSINVYSGRGQALVVGTTAMALTTVKDPYHSDRLNLALVAQGQTIPLGNGALGGSLGGTLEFRSNVLDPAVNALGRMAVAVADSVNQAQAAGVDIYGQRGVDMFTVSPPTVSPHADNLGSATLQASVAQVAQLDGTDLVLGFDGTNWSASRADTGVALPLAGSGTAADPLVINGVSVTVSGTATAGDRFMIKPTGGSAGTLGVAFSDPGMIAAARAVQGKADLDNVGNATVANLSVVDPGNASLQNSAEVQFLDAGQYTVDGGGPYSYAPGDTISANGWSFTLDGAPAAGDSFSISATAPGSSDNGNVLRMAVLDDSKPLDGGNLSLNAALSSFTTTVASAASQARNAHESEQTINNQALAARDSISGVNLDQEAADLIKYQQAYQAAAKIIASADNIFQTLLQAV